MPIEVVAGVDIGGSHAEVCLLGYEEGEGGGRRRLRFLESAGEELRSREQNEVVDLVARLIRTLATKHTASVVAIGVGCPGQSVDGVLVAASNFPTWHRVPLLQMLGERFPSAVRGLCLLNDSDAALAGEIWSHESSFKAAQNVAMITLGTGVGTSLLLQGKFYAGANGLIEGGHMIIDRSTNARMCGCGQRGCAEAYASASNTAKRYLERAKQEGKAGSSLEDAGFGAVDVFSRAKAGDAIAREILEETFEVLALLCINLCRVSDPDVIILAGGMSKAGDDLIQGIKRHISRLAWTCLPQNTPIVVSSSGHGGAMGAAFAAERKLGASGSHAPSGAMPTVDAQSSSASSLVQFAVAAAAGAAASRSGSSSSSSSAEGSCQSHAAVTLFIASVFFFLRRNG